MELRNVEMGLSFNLTRASWGAKRRFVQSEVEGKQKLQKITTLQNR